MLDKKTRVLSLLDAAIQEMQLLIDMSERITAPSDFGASLDGLVVFRACGMSLQYVTESFVKIRNLCSEALFAPYPQIPWKYVFGMRNFLSHDYGEVDEEGIFTTVKESIPELLATSRRLRDDIESDCFPDLFPVG